MDRGPVIDVFTYHVVREIHELEKYHCNHVRCIECFNVGTRQKNVGGFDWERERGTGNSDHEARKSSSWRWMDEAGERWWFVVSLKFYSINWISHSRIQF